MKRNKKKEPQGATRGTGEDEATANLLLPLDYNTDDSESQVLTIGRALRLRDAMITLERRLLEARIEFEVEIAEALKGGAA